MTRQDRLAVYLFACLLTAGCAGTPKPVAPIDDRLQSVDDLIGSQYRHIDNAADANDKTLAAIDKARKANR